MSAARAIPGRAPGQGARRLRVAVVGAGLGGLATAVKLKEAGVEDFTIFEQSEGAGGTWWDNSYPGCAVDSGAHLYSFKFLSHDWSRTHARRDEILDYVRRIVDEYGLAPHIRYSVRIERVVWDDAAKRYDVFTDAGEQLPFDLVVSCVGALSVPRYPEWPGMDEFEGPMFHTSRWRHDVDLAGKRVAYVGTGSTAAQAIPAIAPTVGQLHVFQREPGWVVPKHARDLTPAERERFRRWPFLRTLTRYKSQWHDIRLNSARAIGSRAHRKLHAISLSFINSEIRDPELRKLVTPTYPWGCKRPVIDDDFYSALTRENVELVPRAVERLTKTGVVDDAGVERDVDVLILSTGFQPQNYLATLDITGPGGRRLHEVWGDDPRAFLGMTVAGFPNFFMLYGPNTNSPTIPMMLERQAQIVAATARRMQRAGKNVVETRDWLMSRYTAWVDRQCEKRLSASNEAFCHNYYFAGSGRNVVEWPLTDLHYRVISAALAPLGFATSRQDGTVTADRAVASAAAVNGSPAPVRDRDASIP